jgi:hypothetical protein
MRLSEATTQQFYQHGGFAPRYGWIRKAYKNVKSNSQIFRAEDALVQLGVGKNMVQAIKFWGLASKVIAASPAGSEKIPGFVPTYFGESLFGDNGWDPFLEDPTTMWLTHWALFSPPCSVPVWWHAFNNFSAIEFSAEELIDSVTGQIDQIAEWQKKVSQGSLKRDADALFLTYAPHNKRGDGLDDRMSSPLRQLNLINRSATTAKYRFAAGIPSSLKPEIAAAIVLDYVDRVAADRSTITFGHLATEPGAPGRVLRLSEAELVELLRSQIAIHEDLDLVSPTGAQQLTWNRRPAEIAVTILNGYYPSHNNAAALGSAADKPYKKNGQHEVFNSANYRRDEAQ